MGRRWHQFLTVSQPLEGGVIALDDLFTSLLQLDLAFRWVWISSVQCRSIATLMLCRGNARGSWAVCARIEASATVWSDLAKISDNFSTSALSAFACPLGQLSAQHNPTSPRQVVAMSRCVKNTTGSNCFRASPPELRDRIGHELPLLACRYICGCLCAIGLNMHKYSLFCKKKTSHQELIVPGLSKLLIVKSSIFYLFTCCR